MKLVTIYERVYNADLLLDPGYTTEFPAYDKDGNETPVCGAGCVALHVAPFEVVSVMNNSEPVTYLNPTDSTMSLWALEGINGDTVRHEWREDVPDELLKWGELK